MYIGHLCWGLRRNSLYGGVHVANFTIRPGTWDSSSFDFQLSTLLVVLATDNNLPRARQARFRYDGFHPRHLPALVCPYASPPPPKKNHFPGSPRGEVNIIKLLTSKASPARAVAAKPSLKPSPRRDLLPAPGGNTRYAQTAALCFHSGEELHRPTDHPWTPPPPPPPGNTRIGKRRRRVSFNHKQAVRSLVRPGTRLHHTISHRIETQPAERGNVPQGQGVNVRPSHHHYLPAVCVTNETAGDAAGLVWSGLVAARPLLRIPRVEAGEAASFPSP